MLSFFSLPLSQQNRRMTGTDCCYPETRKMIETAKRQTLDISLSFCLLFPHPLQTFMKHMVAMLKPPNDPYFDANTFSMRSRN